MNKNDESKIKKTELVWPRKRTKVEPVKLPFQTIEVINFPRGAKGKFVGSLFDVAQRQEKLIADETEQPTLSSISQDSEWKNRLIWGDNFPVMGSLLKDFAGKINLIYIDPPFATGQDFSYQVKIGDEEWTKEPSAIEELAYRDTWGKGLESYLQMMYDRLVLMKELLTDEGSIYVHLDWNVSHYVKMLLDEIFGKENLINEIYWHYENKFQFSFSKHLPNDTETLLLYAKDRNNYVLNHQKVPVKNPRKQNKVKWDPVAKKMVTVKDESGKVVYYESTEKLLSAFWDIPRLNSMASERVGFETQKPLALLETAIKVSSNPEDIVADFFCGSGTTGIAAEKLNRRWIMSDLGRYAVHTARKRLLDVGAKPFIVQNLGKYERHRWAKANGSFTDYINFILELYHAEPVEGFINLHGRKGNTFVRIGTVDAPVTLTEIQETLAECKENNIKNLDVLGWEWEMGLHDMVRDEAERYGVKLKTLQIPREVMDVDPKIKEEVHFYELAYLKVGTKKESKKVTVTLEDFILENPELIPAEVREKIKNWSDFIDYWAVDWLFNQHEEKTEEDDVFHNMNQEYRTRKNPKLNLSMSHEYPKAGKYNVLVKVIDIFGNDTTKLVEVKV